MNIEEIAKKLGIETENELCKIGFDQIHYSNLKLISAEKDWQEFAQMKEVVPYSFHERSGIWKCEKGYVEGFVICDNKKFSRMYVKSVGTVSLQLTVQHVKGSNIYGLLWSEYDEYVRYLLTEYIPNTYGLIIDGTDMKIKSVEMNINLHLEQGYYAYQRAFLYLCKNAPIQRSTIDIRNMFSKDGCSVYNRNNSTSLIFYNKVAQIMQKQSKRILPDEQKLLRIEFKFSDSYKIRTIFKTNQWYELNDFLFLKRFHETFQKYLVQSFENSMRQNVKMLKTMVRQAKKQNENKWMDILMKNLRDQEDSKESILDIEQIFEVLTDKNGNVSRTRKNLMKSEQAVENSPFLHGYIGQIRALFAQEEAIYNEMCSRLKS